MKRIMIFGGPGSGKSTLARRLGQLLDLPVVHIDHIYWQPGWVARDRSDVAEMIRKAADGPAWVFEGNHTGTMAYRAQRADLVIYLDMGRVLRTWRVVSRSLRYQGRTRPDMAQDCPEQFDWDFLRLTWSYDRTRRVQRYGFLQEWADRRDVRIVRSRAEAEALVRQLSPQG